MKTPPKNIVVLGSGAWGTALAVSQIMAGHHVTLYGRDAHLLQEIKENQCNTTYLPHIALPKTLCVERDLSKAIAQADVILVVVPAQNMRVFLELLQEILQNNQIPLVLCAKGIEQKTGCFMSQIIEQQWPQQNFAILSGPSFAEDVACGRPTAVTIAANKMDLAHDLMAILSGPRLRCYASGDVRGVEIGGALKNILAIAAGIVHGAELGLSAQAALITRGFKELRQIGEIWGGKTETLMGLSGLGDLILTSSSTQSRNFTYGMALAQNKDMTQLKLAEGVATAQIAAKLCREQQIEAPIITTISDLLEQKLSIVQAMDNLLMRPLKYED